MFKPLFKLNLIKIKFRKYQVGYYSDISLLIGSAVNL